MCPPEHFAVEYSINAWMDPSTPVDAELAVKQWTTLREALAAAGHTVHLLTPQPGLPDMVYAANGAVSVDGVVYGARFRYPQRAPEAQLHRDFYYRLGWTFVEPAEINEGEGDFAFVRGMLLAGHGFRTAPAAHAEAQEALGRPVISLRLVDPRFYHLDTALATLTDDTIVYFPGAFSEPSQRVLRQLFPDAMIADETDAVAFGLNLVSDGRNAFLNAEATGLAAKLAAAGFHPVPLDLSELKKGGGSVKCCIAELRGPRAI
nr:dimethylargininase [Allorhizocola rhizosphaerae]